MQDAERVGAFFGAPTRALRRVMAEDLPEDVSIGIAIRGDGGGVWTVVRDATGARLEDGIVEPVDCRLECSVEDFEALLNGDLDGRRGFLEGRLQIEGDVGLVLKMNAALAKARR